MSLADISAGKTVEADQILGLLIAICAGAILGLELYRKRPMEAAGKAMAFKKTMAPIRIRPLSCSWYGKRKNTDAYETLFGNITLACNAEFHNMS